MIALARRRFARLAAGSLAAPAVARFAHAAEFNWRVGHAAPLDTPLHRHLLEAADAIAKRTDGQMQLTVVGEGRAGDQAGLLDQVRNGRTEMTAATGALLGQSAPLFLLPLTGFMFNDHAKVWSAMDGEMGRLIRSQTPAGFGIEVLENVWDYGFRQITTAAKPIQVAADIAGLKIRTQIDSDEMDLFRALSAIPVVISLRYLRAALEHHQVDGQEGMPQIIQFARLNEVQTWCAASHHIWDGLWLCVNAAAWRRLPDRPRNVVENTLNGAAQRQREDNAKAVDAIRASLVRAGMKFTDVDAASFRDVLRQKGYYARAQERFGAEAWAVAQRATDIPA